MRGPGAKATPATESEQAWTTRLLPLVPLVLLAFVCFGFAFGARQADSAIGRGRFPVWVLFAGFGIIASAGVVAGVTFTAPPESSRPFAVRDSDDFVLVPRDEWLETRRQLDAVGTADAPPSKVLPQSIAAPTPRVGAGPAPVRFAKGPAADRAAPWAERLDPESSSKVPAHVDPVLARMDEFMREMDLALKERGLRDPDAPPPTWSETGRSSEDRDWSESTGASGSGRDAERKRRDRVPSSSQE